MSLEPDDKVYLDANFLTGYFVKDHVYNEQCQKKFAELLASNALIYISPLALDEYWMATKREADNIIRSKKGYLFNILNCIKRCCGFKCQNWKLTKLKNFAPEFKRTLNILKRLGVNIIEYNENAYDGLEKAIDNISVLNFQPRDAVHLSLIQHHGLNKVIAKDRKSFGRLQNNGKISVEDY